MRKNYKIGMLDNKIGIDVTIGTPGIAHTIVFQILNADRYEILKESSVDSGNIDINIIGTGKSLIGSYLKIRTAIDFGSIDSSQWEQLAKKIVAKYTLSGGFDGNQTYSYDEDDKTISDNGRTIIIDKEINLIS